MRSILLLVLNLKSFIHKIRYDLVNECVVGICSLVLFSTFFYIFNDFLNDKVASISSSMKEGLSKTSSLILVALLSYFISSFIKKERIDNSSFTRFSFFIGESPTIRRMYRYLRASIITVVLFSIGWWIIYRYIHRFSFSSFLIIQILSLIFIYILTLLNFSSSKKIRNFDYTRCHSLVSTMVRFRLNSIRRSHLSLFFLVLSFISILNSCYFLISKAPLILSMLLCFLAGFFIASITSCQTKQDLESIWIDRLVGVSEKDFFKTYRYLILILSGIVAIPLLIALSITILNTSALTGISTVDILKLPFILLVCPYLMPNLIFQIDPKRPIIQILIVFMIGLFVATALWASWLALLLVFIINYYGRTTQEKRFYRV